MLKTSFLVLFLVSASHFMAGQTSAPGEGDIPLGPVNKMAKILPMPQLLNAGHLKQSTEILVRIIIDLQRGEVIDAEIRAGGHPLIDSAVLKAARGAKFNPTLHEFPMVRGSAFLKYTLDDFNKADVKDEKPPGFLIITKGELNSRAGARPKPKPVMQDKKYVAGRVEVKVLVSAYEGNVVAVVAASGPKQLREASERAAMKVKFNVSHKAGRPIYVKGFIVFTFTENGKVN